MFSGGCTENIPVICSEYLEESLYAALDYYVFIKEYEFSMPWLDQLSLPALCWRYLNPGISSMGRKMTFFFSGQDIASILLPPAADRQWGTFQQIIECCSPILCLCHGSATKLECQICYTGSIWAGPLNSVSLLWWRCRLAASQQDTNVTISNLSRNKRRELKL